MTHNEKSGFKYALFLGLVLTAALIPWLAVRIQQATNSDILWLCEVMQRWLSGMKITVGGYENNPPLSMLTYTIPVLLKDWLNLPLHYTTYVQSLIILIGATAATYKILSSWKLLKPDEIFMIIAAYLLANTIGSSLYFGERDQLIGMVLMPFVLIQVSISFNLPYPKNWKWPVLLLGTLFILIKPHHGLLPTLIIAHRFIMRKNLSFLKDADFISLALLTPLYIAFVCLVFPDYVNVILPDTLRLYISKGTWSFISGFTASASILCFMLAIANSYIKINPVTKNLTFFFIFCAAISIIPYVVQGFGFYYHTMPVISFIAPAIALLMSGWLKTQVRQQTAVIFTTIFIIVFAYAYAPLNLGYPHHADYPNLPLSKLLEKDCPSDKACSFYMFNRDMGINTETSYYMDIPFGSRFITSWYLPVIVQSELDHKQGKHGALSVVETNQYIQKYGDMTADDFARWKPDIVLLWKPGKSFMNFDFIKFFSADKKFAAEWSHYRKYRTISLDYKQYYRSASRDKAPLEYDVYKRISR